MEVKIIIDSRILKIFLRSLKQIVGLIDKYLKTEYKDKID